MQRDTVAFDSGELKASQFSEETEETTASSQGGLNLGPLLRTIQRKILLIVGLTGAAGMAANHYLIQEPTSTYQGHFQMLVEPVSSTDKLADPLTLTRTQGNPNENLFSLDYPTQLQILQSPEILDEIVNQVQAEYPKFSLQDIQKNLTVERLAGENKRFDVTKILEIKYQGSDPDLVELVLEETAKRYEKYSVEERSSGIQEGVKFIDAQLPDLERRVNSYQTELQNLQQDYQLVNPETRAQELYEQIRVLESQSNEAQRLLQELRTQYVNLQAQLNFTPNEALAASALSEAPNRTQLLASLAEIEREIAKQSAVYNDNTPEMQLLLQQRANIQQLLDQETQQVLGENSANLSPNSSVLGFQSSIRQQLISQLVDVSNQIEMLEVRLAGLQESQSRFERQAQVLPSISRRYAELQQKLELANGNLKRFLEQREKLLLESAQDNVPWEVISRPKIEETIEDNSQKTLMMGIVGGLVAGLVLAILLEKIHNIFYSIDDLKDTIKNPILGIIPRQKRKSVFELFSSSQQKQSRFMDAFDVLYANVRFLYGDSSLRSLAVCSAESGDGKSTVALHLAQTIASMGQKVLIVDANLRHPQLHQSLGLPNQKGLSNLLTDNRIAPSILIQQSQMTDNLFALTAGTPTAAAIKLLGSAQMRHIVDELQKTFDLVIYDTPQLRDYTDASFLCGHLDGLLLVVGIAKTHQSVTQDVLAQLDKFRLPCLGVVANHAKKGQASTNPPYLLQTMPVHKTEEVEQLI
ncbi:MAG: polysaccharide biosynthesis tyrosine autokinase [Limnoraphis sp. WC205]|jgi:succinoglycan biosynthesis transport protein ExoP|nr:polysaccharide biosynthesis tyrosine autokinase [Limnoraphis sp. WC205]